MYRQWRQLSGGNILPGSLGNNPVREGYPLKADHRCTHKGRNVAKTFRHLVLQQTKLPVRQGKAHKPTTTPPIPYSTPLHIATQNAQGTTELLKHQAVLKLVQQQKLDVLFVTETHAKAYHSFHSESHLFVVNGNTKDKWSGVTAVIAPHIIPFVKNIIQHSSRVLQVTLSTKGGDTHLLGVYAPHDKSDDEIRKQPVWGRLEEIISATPLPEPIFILGDFNVRLQGRHRNEYDHLGPHVYGRGPLHIKHAVDSNRSYYMSTLQGNAYVDALSFKPQPNLLKHITYRDKHPPPASWAQFLGDPLIMLQFWGIVQSLPMEEILQLHIASEIRSYLDMTGLPQMGLAKPRVDPHRFQSLDRIITPRKWLPAIKQVSSKLNTGFPSDHYLLKVKIQVKLGAKLPKMAKPPSRDYLVDEVT